MAREFAGIDRGQMLLMPPSLLEWLPEDHLVWSVLGAVDQMDLGRFAERYRLGAAGRAPLDPQMMGALLLYAYARGIRSSRAIERACWEDVAFKVIAGMRTPDHSTIAEFRRRHEAEIGELFDEVLGLCAEAGLVSVGVITIDGTKIKANASMDQNRSYSGLVRDILREAEETDRREDELYGDRRGDELPEPLRDPATRRQALADAKCRLAERKQRPAVEGEPGPEDLEMDLEAAVMGRPVLRRGGRIEWLRVARRELEARRTRQAAPIARDRDDRMIDALERLEENHRVDLAAVETYERWRRTARDTKGRVLKGNTKPYVPSELPEGVINRLRSSTSTSTMWNDVAVSERCIHEGGCMRYLRLRPPRSRRRETAALVAIISVMALTCTLALDGAFARSGPVSSLSRSYKVVRIMTGPHIPSGPVWIGDLGLVANGRFYFADISNDQVDVFSTHRLRFVGAVPGFMLPSAVAAVGHAIWASNGDSTVKIVGPGRLRIRASVSTRGKSRADDLAWDPVDDTVIVVNSGDQPPFLSFVNARTRRVAGRLSLRSATDVGQPIWDPVARLFFVPVTVAKAGEVVGVSPTSHRVVRKFHIPCAPSGFVLGPRQEAALACDTRALIVDLGRRGRIVKSFPTLGGGDQVAYDSGLERYYMTAAVHTASASIAVVDAVTRRQLTSWRVGTLTHSLGVDSVTHRVFVPGSTGVVVYSPGG